MAEDPHRESRHHPAQSASACWCSVPLLQGLVPARTRRALSAADPVACSHLRPPRRRTHPPETAGRAGMPETRTDAHPLKSQAAERCVLARCVSSDSCPRHRSAIPPKLPLPLLTLALHPTLQFTPLGLWPPALTNGERRGHGPRSLRTSSCPLRAPASSPTAGETGQQTADSEQHRSFEAQR